MIMMTMMWSSRFDGLRNFSVLRVHANNLFHRDVRVFAAATVSASDVSGPPTTSTGGGSEVRYSYRRDSLSESARSVSVSLHHLVASTLIVRLDFDARWIMLSEIQFDSSALWRVLYLYVNVYSLHS